MSLLIRLAARLGIVVDVVDLVHRPDIVVVLGRVNVRRFIVSNPGENQ